MKVECEKEKFTKAVQKAEKISGRGSNLPILSCLLISATGKSLKIRSTNIDLAVEITLSAKVEKEGVVAVPASILSNFLNNLPGKKNLTLFEKDGNIEISSEIASTTIKSFPTDDFPLFPSIQKEFEYQIPSNYLLQGVRSVQYSALTSNIKPELSSICMYSEGGQLYFVATDSFRLSEKHFPFKGDPITNKILIPYKNFIEIIKFFEEYSGDVSVIYSKNQIFFLFDTIYLTSRLVEGNFPDYRQIIPKEFSTEATLLKEDFLNALKVNNVFVDKFNQLTFILSPKEKKITLISQNADVGKTNVSLPSAITGEAFEIRFNHRYVSDCLPSITKESVVLRFSDKNKPLAISGVGDNSFLYIVMPMNR
ncbi:MAG: DNA polymerase III subunit beta [Patescibacteria group bacterium]